MYLDTAPTADTPETHRLRVGALDIAYDVRGEGEPLLLVPGLTMARLMWPEELCDLLARTGFRVIRMDNRDSGESSHFEGRPPNVLKLLQKSVVGLPFTVPYTLEDMANDAFALMTSLGHERFHVAGASMGGMIAQTMAIMAPERLLTLTSIMSGPGGRRYAIGKLGALRALLTPLPKDAAQHIDHLVGTFRVLNGDELPFDELASRRYAEVHCASGLSPAASARQLGAIFHSAGRRMPLVWKIGTPTLVIHGSADPLLPLRGAVAMARNIAGAELVVVPGMGHNFPPSSVPQVAGAIASHARRAALRARTKAA